MKVEDALAVVRFVRRMSEIERSAGNREQRQTYRDVACEQFHNGVRELVSAPLPVDFIDYKTKYEELSTRVEHLQAYVEVKTPSGFFGTDMNTIIHLVRNLLK